MTQQHSSSFGLGTSYGNGTLFLNGNVSGGSIPASSGFPVGVPNISLGTSMTYLLFI